jgi:regulator of replication initiation timing
MMQDFLMISVPVAVTSIITWFLSRRKYRAESQAKELDNVQKALCIYRDTIGDLKKELEQLRDRINVVVAENEALGRQMEELRKELACTRGENKRLIGELKKYNAKITENEI